MAGACAQAQRRPFWQACCFAMLQDCRLAHRAAISGPRPYPHGGWNGPSLNPVACLSRPAHEACVGRDAGGPRLQVRSGGAGESGVTAAQSGGAHTELLWVCGVSSLVYSILPPDINCRVLCGAKCGSVGGPAGGTALQPPARPAAGRWVCHLPAGCGVGLAGWPVGGGWRRRGRHGMGSIFHFPAPQ